MATKNVVPRATGEGGLGTAAKKWLASYITTMYVDHLEEATGSHNIMVGAGNLVLTNRVQVPTTKFVGRNLADSFTYDSLAGIPYECIGWKTDTWESNGATTYISGFSGMKFFSNGANIRLAIDRYGYVGVGLANPGTTYLLYVNGYIYGTRVYNAIYNDIADFIELAPGSEVEYGYCYYQTKEGLCKCNTKLQAGVVGIASDTYGYGLGINEEKRQVPIAVAGWVLAYTDKEYPIGTALVNDENGRLVEITQEERANYSERIVATYMRVDEKGSDRHWVKVK